MAKIFISYSHDTPEHCARVLALAHALLGHGMDVELDQFHHHKIIDWPRWCNEGVENADFVLCICTPEYKQRIEGKVPPTWGKGVYWEGALIDDELYDAKGNERFLPVLFDGNEERTAIPRILRGWTFCHVTEFDLHDTGYESLLRILSQQPAAVKPTTTAGAIPKLPPQTTPIAHHGFNNALAFALNGTLRKHRRLWTVAVLLGGLGMASWLFYFQPRAENFDRHMALARRYMDTGLYQEARGEYAQAAGLALPLFGAEAARLGWEKADIGAADTGKAETLAHRLNALLARQGEDADLLLLAGERHYWNPLEKAEALPAYRKALELRPQLAEAGYRLGVLYQEAGAQEALGYLQRAYQAAPEVPHYAVAYAGALLKQGRNGDAIEILAPVKDYPLARLEQAKAHWALGEWDRAEALQAEALRGLAPPAGAGNPRLGYSWTLDLADADRVLHLSSEEGKRCYAGLALAASRYFQSREQAAQQTLGQAGCTADIRETLALDIRRYAAHGPARLASFFSWLGAPIPQPFTRE